MDKITYNAEDIDKVLDYLEGKRFRDVAGLILLLRSGEIDKKDK